MFNVLKNNYKKFLICLLAVLAGFSSLTLLTNNQKRKISEYQKRLKSYDVVQDGEEKIDGTDYITFDAFFLEDLDNDGNAEGIRGNSIEIDGTKKLWIELKVLGDATLTNGQIQFVNSNVTVGGNISKSSVFKNNINSTSISSIALQDTIGNGVSSLTPLNIKSYLTNDLKSYSGKNKVILTGTIINENNEKIDISKEVEYEVDWYGDRVISSIQSDYTTSYDATTYNSDTNAKIIYNVKVNALTNLLLKSTNYEGVVGKLNGYDPVSIKVEGAYITPTYDLNNNSFKATREASLTDTLITSQAYDYRDANKLFNELKIIVEYPPEASINNATATVNLKVNHQAYNNQSADYENIITSDDTSRILIAKYVPDVIESDIQTIISTAVTVGDYSSSLEGYYINKTNALNLYDNNEASTTKYKRVLDTYFADYNGSDSVQSIIIKEADYDKLNETSLNGIASYKSIKFSNVASYLGKDGYIKMIDDDTNEVIHVFTSSDWNDTYQFENNNVYKLRFETSPLTDNVYVAFDAFKKNHSSNEWMKMFSIEETKQINDNALVSLFTEEEFNNLSYMMATEKTDFTYYKHGENNLNTWREATTQVANAKYITYQSSPLEGKLFAGTNEINQLNTTEEKEVKIQFEATSGYDIIKEWQNGEFIVVLPEPILDIDIDSVIINNTSVKIVGYEKIKIDNHQCIKILTENNTPESYKILITGTVKPNAKTVTGSYPIKVYGINPGVNPSTKKAYDYYDIDDDGNTTELVTYTDINLTLTSPNEVITTTTLTNYSSEDTTSISPEIAEVNPVLDDSDATVEVGIINNSLYSVKDIYVIGKIGFEGNTYQIGTGSLGSEYDIHMAQTGINIPSELADKVTVYYSYQDAPTGDIEDTSNNWKEKQDVTDFNAIKTYMIVIDDYTLAKGREINFTYNVEMPLLTENLNKVTYFNHGVYYNVITDAGDYGSSVGGSKLGIRMSRQYDLELTDLKIASERPIAKSRYLLTEEDGTTHILTTNNEGKASLKDLYVNRLYKIKQISVNAPYILDDEEKTFKVVNDSNNNLVLEHNGEYKSINLLTNKTLKVNLENETRYTVILTNTDFDTDESIALSQFKITGKGYENGITLVTGEDGKLTLNNLYLNEEYEVKQVKATNYLSTSDFTIKLERDTNNEVKEKTIDNPNVTQIVEDGDNQDAPLLMLNVKSKRIPTYNLELTKVDAVSKEKLANAQYKIIGPGLPADGKIITTDANGVALIELNKGFNLNGYSNIYKIQEVVAPVGYTLDNEVVSFEQVLYYSNNACYFTNCGPTEKANNRLNVYSGGFKESEYDEDSNTLKVTMYDYPIISITKTDGETGEVLPNTLFAIDKVNTSLTGITTYTRATDVNGNIIGDKISIDGNDYYVVATDENGKLNVALSSGKYRLKEIQAADDKYEVDSAVYYFGVGETVNYQPEGLALSGLINANFVRYGGSYGYPNNNLVATSDGGWIATDVNGNVIKFKSSGEVEWQKNYNNILYGNVYVHTYYDKPGYYFEQADPNYSVTGTARISDIIKSNDGGYYLRAMNSPATHIIIKIDEDGNIIWQNDRYSYYLDYEYKWEGECTYEGNSQVTPQGTTVVRDYYFDTSVNEWKPESNYHPVYDYQLRDNETYYCKKKTGNYANFNWFTYGGKMASTNDGRVLFLTTTTSTGNDVKIYLTDVPSPIGEYDPDNPEEYINYKKGSYGTLKDVNHYTQLLIYSKDGALVDSVDIYDKMITAKNDYMTKYGLTSDSGFSFNDSYGNVEYNGYLGVYPNNDVLVIIEKNALKLRKNETTGDWDIVWYTPLAVNGMSIPLTNYYNYEYEVRLTEDGGFSLLGKEYPYWNGSSKYDFYKGANIEYDIPTEWTTSGEKYIDNTLWIFEFGEKDENNSKQAYLTNMIPYIAYRSRNIEAINEHGNTDMNRLVSYTNRYNYYLTEDGGYIISGKVGYGYNSFSTIDRTIILADGTQLVLAPYIDFVIFKMNKEGKIEWIKQYNIGSQEDIVPKIVLSEDKTKIAIPVKGSGQPIMDFSNYVHGEPYEGPTITNMFPRSNYTNFMIFDVISETLPESPEAYTLNVKNNRKEFKVTASSNTGGHIIVTNPENGNEVLNTDGINKTLLEKVKYGDSNYNNIMVKPNIGYVISSIKVNGEDANYTINDDLSVTLDKIENITEDKNIEVTYSLGLSTVIVKHYLKNTDQKVFSDELVTGHVGDPYSVEPQVSDLYSVATNNGELILPNNMTGNFKVQPITVIFYYEKNEVDLKTNYYIENTEVELAPTKVERKLLGSSYKTTPLDIDFYELTRVIGQEEGTLTNNLTQVTYMYQQNNEANITVKYIDKDTNKDIVEPVTMVIQRHQEYTTSEATNIPAKYRLVSKTDNYKGTAEDANIEVTYYYEVIPFNLKVDKKISSVLINGNIEDINDGKDVKLLVKEDDSLIVYYEIEVENTGDIKATFNITENEIPNFEIYDLMSFKKQGNKYIISDTLEQSQKATYKIAYKWQNKKFGISNNNVEITKVENELGFDEPDDEDNKSTASIEVRETKKEPVIIDDDTEENDQPEEKIPNTHDNINKYITMFIFSLVGFITAIICFKKRMSL